MVKYGEWREAGIAGFRTSLHKSARRLDMSVPPDPSAKLRAEVDSNRVNFLKTEVALGLTFAAVAARHYETGNHESAERSVANSEKAYETASRFLSDPKHLQHLAEEEVRELTGELERLRERLDGLGRQFRK